MGLRERVEAQIRAKEEEIREYEAKITAAQAFIQGLQFTLKHLSREESGGSQGSLAGQRPEQILRRGSNIDKAYQYLKQVKKPMYIEDILKAIGKTTSKEDRAALAGSLSWYVRKNLIFTRPSPGTYGLKEMNIDFGASAAELWESIREEIKKSGKLPLAAKMRVAVPKSLKDHVLTVSESMLPFKEGELEAINKAAEALGGFKLKIPGRNSEEPPENFGIDFNEAEKQEEL